MLTLVRRHWRVIVVGLAGAGVFLILARRAELDMILMLLRRAQWRWLVGALALQFAVYANFAAVFRLCLTLLGTKITLWTLYPPVFVGVILNRFFPSSGTAFLLYQMRRRGVPMSTATLAVTLNLLSGLPTFVGMLLGALVYRSLHDELERTQIASLVLVIIGVASVCGCAYRLQRDRVRLTHRVLIIKRHLGNLLQRSWDDRPMLDTIAQFYDGQALLQRAPLSFFWLIGMHSLALLLDSFTLLLLFAALGAAPGLGTVLLAYASAYLVSTVSSLPGGGGSFEVVMTLAFSQLGVPVETALAVTGLYRLLTLWLPLVGAGLVVQRVPGSGRHRAADMTPRQDDGIVEAHHTGDTCT